MTDVQLLEPLTPRQTDVARLLAQGKGTEEIRQELGITYGAAQLHVNGIAEKIPNPRGLKPLALARQWAIAQEYLRTGGQP